jgi:hypothetical protein
MKILLFKNEEGEIQATTHTATTNEAIANKAGVVEYGRKCGMGGSYTPREYFIADMDIKVGPFKPSNPYSKK